jgi:Protein of unknown function (DUF3307)
MPFITADQLLAHAVGDYVLQSEWMATRKGRDSIAAGLHALCYTIPFLLLTGSPAALAFIAGTHFVIDRWRLARYVVWLKNRPFPGSRPWRECRATGYPPETPPYLSAWLLILVDNIMHVSMNGFALACLA